MSKGSSYWGKPKAEVVTVSPRCDWCGSLVAPHCRSEPGPYSRRKDKGYRRACDEHEADLEAEFQAAYVSRLAAISVVKPVVVDAAAGQAKSVVKAAAKKVKPIEQGSLFDAR